MEWLSGKAFFSDFLELNVFLTAYNYGLGIQVVLTNTKPSTGRNQVQEYPHFILESEPSINLGFVSGIREQEILTNIESNVGLWNIYNDNQPADFASMLIPPQQSTFNLDYIAVISPDKWIRMKEVAETRGVVEFKVSVSVSFSYRPSATQYEFFLWHSIVPIIASKIQIEEFIATWTASKESLIDLPGQLPPEVFRDMVEASKCLDIEASRAASTMTRRALQQALIDRGADKTKELYNQITDLNRKGLLTDDVASLAHGIRHLGNFGAHPESDQLKEVSLEDAKISFQITSKILRQLYPK